MKQFLDFCKFIEDGYTKDDIAKIYRELHKPSLSKSLTFGNLTVISCPTVKTKAPNGTVIMTVDANCKNLIVGENNKGKGEGKEQLQVYIAALDDGRRIYKLYNADFCRNYELDSYPHDLRLSDLNVEKLSDKTFCEKFIMRENKN